MGLLFLPHPVYVYAYFWSVGAPDPVKEFLLPSPVAVLMHTYSVYNYNISSTGRAGQCYLLFASTHDVKNLEHRSMQTNVY